ncbi:4-hydroxy-3-polyprenylbenzoate decarboxylase [Desulfosarcina sp. BuS5]|uniref:menaquinone biosynthesis decarboxylase n=1 Tax=Desulfosarcina sp. BuS5 TaxID=933262 RepID=UPI0009FF45E8|nr:menaquinone biosynthesis decarboxylase [Desulfosarcina sp. BuS5]WDN90387.1 4-hydroxy-3-polyprenylbenzoate decarboxylase [Desulfosarcina sp. BuS5]
MYKNLKGFLEALDRAGEINYISEPVSVRLEISRFTDRESKRPEGGKALFFKNVKESPFPVVTNIFGSTRRICMALGVDNLDSLGARIREFTELNPPKNFKEALNIIPLAINASNFFPRAFKGKSAPCQEIVLRGAEVDLSKLPVLWCWPGDAGPFVTLPLVFTKSLVTGRRNAGMYRLQIFDKNTTGMHWHIHKDGSHYYNEYCKAAKRMPVAVAIGADPAVTYAATAPMPRGIDEMILAGFIKKKPVRMVRCLTIDMEVPAEAEFILEGYVDPGEFRREGPFGDHTGYYSLADDYPVFHVTAVTHRKNPVYNATLVGRPPMEDCYLAKATERLFLPMLQTVMPEICDYWFPWEGVFHNIVIVAIDKEFPGHAQKIMSGLWGQGQMSFCKAIIIVDKNINPADPEMVLKELLTKFDITSDITITKGVLDVLDHSSPFTNFGNKIGIDLTERFSGEPPRSGDALYTKEPGIPNEPVEINNSRQLFQDSFKNNTIANRIIAFSVEKDEYRGGKHFADILLSATNLESFNILILFDNSIDLSDNSTLLWKLFNNVDPGRDLIFKGKRVVIDACKKLPVDGHAREWPEELIL